jgi:hypothetical protein
MTHTMWGAAVGALALATAASAQNNSQSNGQICLEPCQLCMQKIQGGGSGGVYDNACAQCDQQRTSARQQGNQASGPAAQSHQAQGTGSGAMASQGSSQPTPGSDVRASLDQAGRTLSKAASGAASDASGRADQFQRQQAMASAGGARLNTIITDVVGTFNGQGLNVEYQRPIADRIVGVVGANYSRATSTTGDLTTFGGEVGADYFPFTYAGQGFRVGPRLALNFGRESVDNTRYLTDFGLGGEAGYNWQLSSGLSFQLAAGLGGRIGGALTSGLDTKLGGDFGPYGKINIGWSW